MRNILQNNSNINDYDANNANDTKATINISYLSWKAHKTIDYTLNSHKMFLDQKEFDAFRFTETNIFFQEISDKDVEIAKKYNLNIIGKDNTKNVGIKGAFIELAKNCNADYFIFCENDFVLNHDKTMFEDVINDCLLLFYKHDMDYILLRDRFDPGHPVCSREALYFHTRYVYKTFDDPNLYKLNYEKYSHHKLDLAYWLSSPDKVFPEYIKKIDNNLLTYDWFQTTSRHQAWSNNIFIIKTSVLKDQVLNLIQNKIDKVPFLLESSFLNENLNLNMAIGRGVFTHRRIDR